MREERGNLHAMGFSNHRLEESAYLRVGLGDNRDEKIQELLVALKEKNININRAIVYELRSDRYVKVGTYYI